MVPLKTVLGSNPVIWICWPVFPPLAQWLFDGLQRTLNRTKQQLSEDVRAAWFSNLIKCRVIKFFHCTVNCYVGQQGYVFIQLFIVLYKQDCTWRVAGWYIFWHAFLFHIMQILIHCKMVFFSFSTDFKKKVFFFSIALLCHPFCFSPTTTVFLT